MSKEESGSVARK